MVLLSSPIKDNLLEYKNLLAFLNSEEEDNGDHVEDHARQMLRARLTCHVAYERKGDFSKNLEYWVPSYLSQEQLQLYSSILVTNSSTLQSQIETDSVGALHDIVVCLWKCYDHPCLVDEFPQNSLINIDDANGLMCASGKLLILEKKRSGTRGQESLFFFKILGSRKVSTALHQLGILGSPSQRFQLTQDRSGSSISMPKLQGRPHTSPRGPATGGSQTRRPRWHRRSGKSKCVGLNGIGAGEHERRLPVMVQELLSDGLSVQLEATMLLSHRNFSFMADR